MADLRLNADTALPCFYFKKIPEQKLCSGAPIKVETAYKSPLQKI